MNKNNIQYCTYIAKKLQEIITNDLKNINTNEKKIHTAIYIRKSQKQLRLLNISSNILINKLYVEILYLYL